METPKVTTHDVKAVKPEALQIAEQLIGLTSAALMPAQTGEAWFVNIPPGYTQKDITELVEKAAPVPARKRGAVALGDVPSLLAYCADQQAQDEAYIYADPDARSITAVFNDQRDSDVPGWRDHRAVFKAEHTPEFQLWMSRNKQKFSQTEFAEFIEDNIADISGDDGTTLLKVATTIAATTGINFSSAKRLQDGQTQLTYNETNNAVAGADGSLQIPQKFSLGLRIFKNGTGYAMSARLKYRINSGAVAFFYELERTERSVEDAFNGYVEEVRKSSAYTVLIGKP